jgi:hypothetical protein
MLEAPQLQSVQDYERERGVEAAGITDLAEPALLPSLVGSLVRGGATCLVGVIYDAGPARPLPWRGLLGELQGVLETQPCELGELLRVAGGRWWSYLCQDEQCCPAEGNPLPEAPSAFAAGATYEGIVPLPDRAALAATLEPVPDQQRAALWPQLDEENARAAREIVRGDGTRRHRAITREILRHARHTDAEAAGAELAAEQVVRFGAALTVTAVRDAIWMAIEHERADGRALWRELARRLPVPYDAAPLFLFGWTSWRAGDGTRAGIAAERAVASDPGYTAADLLLAALAHGLNPHQVPRMRMRQPRRAA